MNKRIFTAGFLTLSILLPLQAEAVGFSNIYAFGDSLTDTGNVFNASGNTFPPPPYDNGRFSNGDIWVEYLAQKLNLQIQPSTSSGTNFAFGGATTGVDNTINPALPGLQQEVGRYLNFLSTNKLTADPDALYTVWAGANDYLPTESSFIPYTEPTTTVNNLAFVIDALADAGAKNILVVNLPDLGKLPKTNTNSDANRLNTLTQAHNTLLSQTLDNLPLSPDVDISILDVNTLFDKILANPAKYNFTNVTDSCLTNTICSKPDEYFFWDDLHPTTAAHQLIGNLAVKTLGVPEPSFVPGVAVIGIWGVAEVLRRQKQKSSK